MQKDSKKKGAGTPSRRNRKQSGDPIAEFDQIMETDDSPASVRRFIIDFVTALARFAGMTGREYEQDSFTERARLAVQHVGVEALSIALRTAIDTLTHFAPAISRETKSQYQRQADRYAAALLHPQCPESFRQAFTSIYDSLLVNRTNWSHPEMIRSTYVPMREYLDEANYCGTAEGVDESLERLMKTLLPAEVREAIQEPTPVTRVAALETAEQGSSSAQLAHLIHSVLIHPELPSALKGGLYDALNDFQNLVDLDKLCYTPEVIAHSLELYAQEGDAR